MGQLREAGDLNSQEGPSVVGQPKSSGLFQRGPAADAGWGFVLPRADGNIGVYPARNGAVIGSGQEADVRIAGEDVAPSHARIEVRADGVYLEDLRSPGGTFVGGVRAHRIGMTHGDVVRFGGVLTIFAEHGLANYEGRVDFEGPMVLGPRDRAAFVEPARAFARASQSFTIEGGPGLGKTTLAFLAADERGAAGTYELDAAAIDLDAFAAARARKPTTWVVLLAERVPRTLQTELCQAVARDTSSIVVATLETPLDRALGDGLVGPGFAALFNGRRLIVPPLAARREDIPGIVWALARKLGIDEGRITVDWIEQIARAGWPGGVAEIEDVMLEASSAGDGLLDLKSVHHQLTRAPSSHPSLPAADDPSLARDRLVDALSKSSGSIASAARTLGMSRQAVYREAQRLGLEVGKRRLRG